MDTLHIEGDFYSPNINFNPETGIFTMEGNSILSNPVDFYEPIMSWMEAYGNNPKPETVLTINLKYCNTSSSRTLIELLRDLESIHKSGKGKVKIRWIYDPEDEDLLDTGENLSEILDIPFELVEDTTT